MMKLNLGCGKVRLDDWVNADLHGGDVRCDAHRLPFRDETFDRILASHVFEHVRDLPKAIKESWRVLRGDGTLVVRVPYGVRGLYDPFHNRAFDLRTFEK